LPHRPMGPSAGLDQPLGGRLPAFRWKADGERQGCIGRGMQHEWLDLHNPRAGVSHLWRRPAGRSERRRPRRIPPQGPDLYRTKGLPRPRWARVARRPAAAVQRTLSVLPEDCRAVVVVDRPISQTAGIGLVSHRSPWWAAPFRGSPGPASRAGTSARRVRLTTWSRRRRAAPACASCSTRARRRWCPPTGAWRTRPLADTLISTIRLNACQRFVQYAQETTAAG
jgi:hypothetical protein